MMSDTGRPICNFASSLHFFFLPMNFDYLYDGFYYSNKNSSFRCNEYVEESDEGSWRLSKKKKEKKK